MKNGGLENGIKKAFNQNQIAAFYGTIGFGFLAYGYQLVNKITSNDDLGVLYSNGGGVYNGRWMTGLVQNLLWLNSPWWNGLVMLVLLALSAALIVDMLKIKKVATAALIGGLFVVFPSNVSLLMYMFTVPSYACGIFLAVVGAYQIHTAKRIWKTQLGVVCLILSLGFYQAYFSLAAALLLLALIRFVAFEQTDTKAIIRKSLLALLCLAEGMIGYILVQKYLVAMSSQEMAAYQGMASMGQIVLENIPKQVAGAYQNFFHCYHKIFPYSKHYGNVDTIISVLCAVCAVAIISVCICRRRWFAALCTALFAVLLPLACNLVYLYGSNEVHSLMVFGNVCAVIFVISCVDTLLACDNCAGPKRTIVKFIYAASLVLILSSSQTASEVYLRQEHVVNASIQYCSAMVAQIKSLPEYTTDKPVCLVGRCNDPSVQAIDGMYKRPVLAGANTMDQILNTVLYWEWCQRPFFRIYVGFGQPFLSTAERAIFAQDERVVSMPDYPNAGSIQVIDDVIVVHLSN